MSPGSPVLRTWMMSGGVWALRAVDRIFSMLQRAAFTSGMPPWFTGARTQCWVSRRRRTRPDTSTILLVNWDGSMTGAGIAPVMRMCSVEPSLYIPVFSDVTRSERVILPLSLKIPYIRLLISEVHQARFLQGF